MDGDLAARIRAEMPATGVTEQKMFGGICFMLNGNMVAGSSPRGLLLRVGKAQHAAALARGSAEPMIQRGKPMEGYVYVEPVAVATRASLRPWLELALSHVRTLPPKPRKPAKPRR